MKTLRVLPSISMRGSILIFLKMLWECHMEIRIEWGSNITNVQIKDGEICNAIASCNVQVTFLPDRGFEVCQDTYDA